MILDLGDRAKTVIVDKDTDHIFILNKLIDLGKPAFKNAGGGEDDETIEAAQIASGFGIHTAATQDASRGSEAKKIDIFADDDEGALSADLKKLIEIASGGGAVDDGANDINLRLGKAGGEGDSAYFEVLVDGKWSTDIIRLEGEVAEKAAEFAAQFEEPEPAPLLVVAYIDEDPDDGGFNEEVDQLIAAVRDTNDDGEVSVGDTLTFGVYPTDFAGTTASFIPADDPGLVPAPTSDSGDFVVNSFFIEKVRTGVEFSDQRFFVVFSGDETFEAVRIGQDSPQSQATSLYAATDNTLGSNDVIVFGPPGSEFVVASFGVGDGQFIDIETFFYHTND